MKPLAVLPFVGSSFIHTVVNINKYNRYRRIVCCHSKLQPWRLKSPSATLPLSLDWDSLQGEWIRRPSGPFQLWHSGTFCPLYPLTWRMHLSAFFFFFFFQGKLWKLHGWLFWPLSGNRYSWMRHHSQGFLKTLPFFFFFFEVSTAIISKMQCKNFTSVVYFNFFLH